ncbi:S8 family serine peptidase [Catellatospora coxensis]
MLTPATAVADGRGFVPGPACRHGTLIASMLVAPSTSRMAPICPDVTLLIKPVFRERSMDDPRLAYATPDDVAAAIVEAADAGATIINLSAAIDRPGVGQERELQLSLAHAASRGTIVVVAAGNQASVGGTALTGHPWVIPVIGYTRDGRPAGYSNLGACIGRRGLGAASERICGLGPGGRPVTASGTSLATVFVTGAIALLRSLFPDASVAEVKHATISGSPRRTGVTPPLLDGWRSYQLLAAMRAGLRKVTR